MIRYHYFGSELAAHEWVRLTKAEGGTAYVVGGIQGRNGTEYEVREVV
jgi:hypothetical protein